MKKRLQGFIAGALVAALTVGAVPSIAKEAAEQITAVYRNIKLVVDGVLVEPKDANGNTVEPFIYNGTTYLPVRAVGAAFNKEVLWDGEKATVYLGGKVDKPAKELPLWNRSYIECSEPQRLKAYEKDGVGYIQCSADTKGEEIGKSTWTRSYSMTYPVNTLAKTLSGTFYVDEDDAVEGVLKIYNSNGKQLYQSPIMRETTAPVDFEINVEKEISVKFVFEQTAYDYYDNLNMYIKNPTIVSTDY